MDNMGLTRYMSVLMDDAMKQARFFDHEFVMPEHMLLALLRQYAFCQALQEEGVDSLKMHEDLVGWLAKQERVPETIKYLPEPSSLFKTMFGTACALAAAADRQLVNVPHFVQAMFGLQNSEAAFLLCKNVGDRQGEFLASVDSYYPIGEDTGEAGMGMGTDFDDDDYANEYDDDEEEGRRQVVQDWHQLVTCISDKVEEHNPLIGREQELDRTIQVLCRAEKNNPLHIGEAGVGKTALVYGLAKLINENQVPERLKGARIYGMDMGQMLAGAQYRGDFEKRIKMVMEGAVKEGNTIIYIDEIHNMIGAGRGSDGGPDASNMLKQYLEAGDIRFIGSTTYEEYNRYMAQSKGIVRRFQQIDIKEPTEEEAIKILEGLQYKYNKFHNVTYRKERIRRAAKQIKGEHPESNFDSGFRVFKLADSNMKDVYFSPSEYKQDLLSQMTSNIKEDRTDMDLLYGCMLEWKLPLSFPHTSEKVGSYTIHNVNNGALMACFDENIPEDIIRHMAAKKPRGVVFRDAGFADSPAKINVGELFKLLSPDTKVKVI